MASAWHRLYDDDVERLGYTDRLIGFIFAMQNPAASVREIAVETGISLRSAYAAWGLARERSGTPGGTKTEQAKPPPWPPPEESRNKNGTANGTASLAPLEPPSTATTTTTTNSKLPLPPDGGRVGRRPAKRGSYSPEFDRFWLAYPRTNGSKTDAFKRWKALKLPEHELQVDEMVDALIVQKVHKETCDAQGIFCPEFPFAEKWLRGRRWENIPPAPQPKPAPVDQRAFFTDTPEKPHGLPRRKG